MTIETKHRKIANGYKLEYSELNDRRHELETKANGHQIPVVWDRAVDYNIFDNYQCDFQLNGNTDDILSAFFSDAYACFDRKSDIDCVFTDFSKAYDSLTGKMTCYVN